MEEIFKFENDNNGIPFNCDSLSLANGSTYPKENDKYDLFFKIIQAIGHKVYPDTYNISWGNKDGFMVSINNRKEGGVINLRYFKFENNILYSNYKDYIDFFKNN